MAPGLETPTVEVPEQVTCCISTLKSSIIMHTFMAALKTCYFGTEFIIRIGVLGIDIFEVELELIM